MLTNVSTLCWRFLFFWNGPSGPTRYFVFTFHEDIVCKIDAVNPTNLFHFDNFVSMTVSLTVKERTASNFWRSLIFINTFEIDQHRLLFNPFAFWLTQDYWASQSSNDSPIPSLKYLSIRYSFLLLKILLLLKIIIKNYYY